MATVTINAVSKAFGRTAVLEEVSVEVGSGEFLSILGPSGCGKTTLLRIIAGLEAVSGGRVLIGGEDVTERPPERRDIAMMFQSYALLPHLNVAENVRFPLRMRRVGDSSEQTRRVAEALERVRLDHLGDRRPAQLSGGQQQRVALARAIVSDPAVLLLDEPLSNLDARLREAMQIELIELHRSIGLTTIFVTHDQEEALSLSDRILLLHRGRIEQQGSPERVYSAPDTAFVSRFMGSANVIDAVVELDGEAVLARVPDGQRLELPADTALRGKVQLCIRQEDVQLLGAEEPPATDTALIGRVRTRVYLGGRSRYVVEVGGEVLTVLASADATLDRGDAVHVRIDRRRLHVLPPPG